MLLLFNNIFFNCIFQSHKSMNAVSLWLDKNVDETVNEQQKYGKFVVVIVIVLLNFYKDWQIALMVVACYLFPKWRYISFLTTWDMNKWYKTNALIVVLIKENLSILVGGLLVACSPRMRELVSSITGMTKPNTYKVHTHFSFTYYIVMIFAYNICHFTYYILSWFWKNTLS